MNCWICGDSATTGEHKTKQTDLRSELGKPAPGSPLYYHDHKSKNRLVRSFKADFLKSPSLLCAACNNQRTQPHDYAWERLSKALRSRSPAIRPGGAVRVNRIFRSHTAAQMINVQLFFTKLSGCHFLEAGMQFDQAMFSRCILTQAINPFLYLKFGVNPRAVTGMSDVEAMIDKSTGQCACAIWLYSVGRLSVLITYAMPGATWAGMEKAWHPRFGTNRLSIVSLA